MARNSICMFCNDGDHSRHTPVIQAVPEGMMGGVICTCRGECEDGRYKREIAEALGFDLSRLTRPRS